MLLVAEIVIRLFKKPLEVIESTSSYAQFNLETGMEFKPNYLYKEYGVTYRVDSRGFYSPELAKEKKGVRIAYLGDSYSIGPGIPAKKNFPFVVSNELKKKYKNLDYFVAAIGGQSPLQELNIFKQKALPLKPDLVVYEEFDEDIRRDYIYNYSLRFTRLKVWNNVPNWLKQSALVQQAMILAMNFLGERNLAYYEKTQQFPVKNPEEAWKKYTKPSLDEMLRLTREHRAQFVLLYIPKGSSFKNEYIDFKPEGRYILSELSRKWAKKNNVPYVNMYDEFVKHNTEKYNELYLPSEKGFHLTEFAASLTSKKLFEVVNKLDLKRN